MNEKIAWFEEMLTLEPNSKLFLPLAQAYLQQTRTRDAADVLQKGLTYHPEHLEARLLLVQCLAEMDDWVAAQEQSRYLTTTISAFPIFWELWAKQSTSEANHDVALALRLLSMFLRGETIHWGNILEQGLKSVLLPKEPVHDSPSKNDASVSEPARLEQEQTAPISLVEAQTTSPAPTSDTDFADEQTASDFRESVPDSGSLSSEQDMDAFKESPVEESAVALDGPAPEEHSGVPEEVSAPPRVPELGDVTETVQESSSALIQARIPLPRPEDIPGYAARGSDTKEPTEPSGRQESPNHSLENADSANQLTEKEKKYYETRTYADLLADQGEIQEALDLLRKLLRSSSDAKQRRDLKERIRALKEHSQSIPPQTESPQQTQASPSPSAEEDQSAAHTDSRSPELVNTLNRLAQRLEARAQR